MSKTTISSFCQKDHARLDGLLKKFQQLKQTDFPKAKEYFTEFKLGLERHIIWEEDILYPLFEERSREQSPGRHTGVMKSEHILIMKHIQSIAEKIHADNADTETDEQLLLNILFLHNQKEENVFYPTMDRLLSDEDREKVLATFEKNPSTWMRL